MTSRSRQLLVSAVVAAAALGLAAPATAAGSGAGGSGGAASVGDAAPPGAVVTTSGLRPQLRGTGNLTALSQQQAATTATATATGPDIAEEPEHAAAKTVTPQQAAAAPVPDPPSRPITTTHPGERGFVGITHRDQRLADGGDQFSAEPPDQGLCAADGLVFEQVNSAVAVFTATGSQLTQTLSLNRFFGLASAIDRSRNPAVYGPFLSDPRCHYDADVGRWFVTVLELDVNPYTGAFTGRSATLIAVSQTADPTAGYTYYSLDTTNDGSNGTPRRPDCPCLGDFPMIGFDAQGMYITTREFPLFEDGFNGGLVYALSKRALAKAAAEFDPTGPPVVIVPAGPLAGGLADRLEPTITTPGTAHPDDREYFLATTDTTTSSARSIALYALTGTDSLATARPSLRLTRAVLPSQLYSDPPRQRQKPGPRPLGEEVDEPLPTVDAGDSSFRSSSVYTNGLISNVLTTAVGTDAAHAGDGLAWFVVRPVATGPAAGRVVRQGYVRVAGEDLSYASVGVRPDGTGVIAHSVLGPKRYPSSGYTAFSLGQGATGPVHIAQSGARPQDGYSCYEAFGPEPRCRWGDYSQVAMSNDPGRPLFFATEYVPSTARTVNANWGTFVGRLG